MVSPEGKILNPETGRYVGLHTAKGRQIFAARKQNKPVSPPKQKAPSPPKQQSPHKGTVQKTTFKKIKIVDINIKENVPNPNNDLEPPKKTKFSITLVEFLDLVNNKPDFITKFKNAVIKLLEHKFATYSNTEFLPKPAKAEHGEPPAKPPYPALLEKITKTLKILNSPQGNNYIKTNLLDAITNKKHGMVSLIGREDIMNKLAGLLYAFSQNYRIFTKVFLNFAFFGSAGVGKSKIASVVGYVFKHSNILVDGNIVMATRTELIGQYVGQTSNKTRKQLIESLEGVLFIDEAYSLTPCPEADMGKDFGPEAVAELINFMDKTIGLSVIIVAGYKDQMTRCFFPFNEGLDRRFPYKFTLSNYSPENLTIMLINNLEENDIKLTEKTKNYLYSLICMLIEKYPAVVKNQAGDILNFGNMLIQSIYMSYNLNWNDNETTNERIIVSAFEDFLESKGLVMEF
jgi:stage V sporulation protein K